MGIAGIGAVTGYGWGRTTLWNGLASGKPAATLYPGFGPGENDDAWLARVRDEGDPRDGLSRFAQAMRAAAREALSLTTRYDYVVLAAMKREAPIVEVVTR